MFNLLMLLVGAGAGSGVVDTEPVAAVPGPTYIEFYSTDPDLGNLGPLYLKEGDTEPIKFTLRGANRTAQVLTGALISFVVRKLDQDPIIDAEDLEPADAAAGAVSFTPDPAELVPGRYRAQATVVFNDNRRRTFPTRGYADIIIEASLG